MYYYIGLAEPVNNSLPEFYQDGTRITWTDWLLPPRNQSSCIIVLPVARHQQWLPWECNKCYASVLCERKINSLQRNNATRNQEDYMKYSLMMDQLELERLLIRESLVVKAVHNRRCKFTVDRANHRYQPTYNKKFRKFYLHNPNKLVDHFQAQLYCQKLNHSLVQINSMQEIEWILRNMQLTSPVHVGIASGTNVTISNYFINGSRVAFYHFEEDFNKTTSKLSAIRDYCSAVKLDNETGYYKVIACNEEAGVLCERTFADNDFSYELDNMREMIRSVNDTNMRLKDLWQECDKSGARATHAIVALTYAMITLYAILLNLCDNI